MQAVLIPKRSFYKIYSTGCKHPSASPPCIYTAPQLRLHANTYETYSTYYTTKAVCCAHIGQRICRENKHHPTLSRTKELSVHALVPYTHTFTSAQAAHMYIRAVAFVWIGLSTWDLSLLLMNFHLRIKYSIFYQACISWGIAKVCLNLLHTTINSTRGWTTQEFLLIRSYVINNNPLWCELRLFLCSSINLWMNFMEDDNTMVLKWFNFKTKMSSAWGILNYFKGMETNYLMRAFLDI